MSGKATRAKGRRGQTTAKHLLLDRDWNVADLTAGVSTEDFIATDPSGRTWCVEVKNTRNLLDAHISQAKDQARRRGLPWLLMQKLTGSSCWLVRGTGLEPTVWSEK